MATSPATFEQRLAAGEFGDPATAIRLESERRRRLISDGTTGDGGFAALPPDVADLFVRDAGTGMVRRSRGGSARSAILGAFSPTAPLGSSSILGVV